MYKLHTVVAGVYNKRYDLVTGGQKIISIYINEKTGKLIFLTII